MRININPYSFITLFFAWCSMAADTDRQFSPNICGPEADQELCTAYEKGGRNFVTCRWRYFFPTLSQLPLEYRKVIYELATPRCDNWKESEPLSVVPDILGDYCLENGVQIKPLEILVKEKKRAVLCARYELARLYWQENALKIFSQSQNGSINDAISEEQIRLALEKAALLEKYKELLTRNNGFLERQSNITYWSAPTLMETALIVALMWYGQSNKLHKKPQ